MKINFTKPLALFAFGCSSLLAQTGKNMKQVKPILAESAEEVKRFKNRGCATQMPDVQWETQFQQLIAQRNLDLQKGNAVQANYTIPVVIHIISSSVTAVGTYPNISNAQATSQINILNADYAGTGQNATTYPATAFAAYATAAGLAAANKDASGRVKISNFNVSFCLATINKTGGTMAVAGIDRVAYETFSLTAGVTNKNPADVSNGDPNGDGNPAEFTNYMNNVCKPQTIWDPTKYMNIWVTDVAAAAGLLGFATFPAGSTLTGLTSGLGTASTDGLWCWGKSFGNTGTLQAPYNKGRTATHEIGHWFGLRHIGGDVSGGCGTDYCTDTPKNKGGTVAANTGNGFGQNFTATGGYPYQANTCTGGLDANVNGDMFMNFMDYTDDGVMYMLTEDQRTRAQTAMANGTHRKLLGTHGLCSTGAATPAIAAFTMTNSACNNTAVSITNNSTGSPSPTYTWVASPATGVTFSPNANSTAPTITFANAANYVITLSAQSGTTAVSSKTNAITVNTCTVAAVCNATLTNVAANDTLFVGAAGTDTATAGCSPKAGYVFGSNCYDDQEKATFYAASKYSNISGPFITGAVVVFYKNGTAGTTGAASRLVNLKLYNGSLAAGPTGIVGIATATANLGLITASTPTNNIGYLSGDPTVTYNSTLAIPYKYTFTSPIAAPAAGFYLSVVTPTTAGDTAVIFNDFNATANSSWEMWSDNTWHDMTVAWGGLINNMAILPILTCSTKLTELNTLTNNVNIMPNPSNGLFNLAMTLPNTQNITINVTNALGQTVYTNSFKSFSSGVVPVDLSNNEQGIYFITVTNGVDKNVQRVVLTK